MGGIESDGGKDYLPHTHYRYMMAMTKDYFQRLINQQFEEEKLVEEEN